MRNLLLDTVADMEFDYYLSLDSDILCSGLGELVHHLDEVDVVSPTVQMAADQSIINAFVRRPDGWMTRVKMSTVQGTKDKVLLYDTMVDVLCAAKLMKPEVVRDKRVRYGYHPRGEDFFWSNAATSQGYKLMLCPTEFQHVMRRP
jgi:hypothetical protein